MTQLLNQFKQSPELGQLAYGYEPSVISAQLYSETVSAALITGGTPVKLVGFSAQKRPVVDLAGANDEIFGFVITSNIRNKFEANDTLQIALEANFMYLTAGEALSAGNYVEYNSATGKVITATGAKTPVGQVLQNAAINTLAVIRLIAPATPSIETSFTKVLGLDKIIGTSTGTWTVTRNAAGNYSYNKTAADNAPIVGIDITEAINEATGKGLKLTSISPIYLIGVADLDAHSATLKKVVYEDGVAVAVTDIPLTGSLEIADVATPYVTELAVTTPAFNNDANSKYVAEITVDAAATSTYAFYGLALGFSRK